MRMIIRKLVLIFLMSAICGCFSLHPIFPVYEMSIVDGGGRIHYDGLCFSFGHVDNRFEIDCYQADNGDDNLILATPNVHGAQPSMVIADLVGTRYFNETRMLPVRGYPYVVVLTIKNARSSDGVFTEGAVCIQLIEKGRGGRIVSGQTDKRENAGGERAIK